ncbi:MAG: FapA family protein [Lachnospiraceae bacterium]|nr:FapA family protein [Lachnospiraceae bacterium]
MENLDSNKQLEMHFPMTENDAYQKAQHQELKLGMEQGLDVSLYANPEFNWLQMEQIRLGLKDKLDVSVYTNPAYSYETMRQVRLALYSDINLVPYIDRGFTDDDLEEIRLALLSQLPIDQWMWDGMCAPQIREIRIGLCEDLNISPYVDSKYNWMQMQEIRLGLEKKLDVYIYSNHLLSHAQMREIRLGLEAGLDVSSYRSLVYSATDMKEKRRALINQKKSSTPDRGGAEKKNAKKSLFDSLNKKEFVISVEENGNKAYAYIPWVPGNAVAKEDIYHDLERRGIVYGIRHDAIADLIDKRRMNEKVLIAEGIPAARGQDGWFEFFVRLDLPRIPAPLPDGSVDYVNIEAFEMVDEGERIVLYHPAQKGSTGTNIYGESIHAENGTEKKPLRGVGFTIAPDGVTYLSKMNGKFEFVGGRILITNMLVVREDVTAVTGKLEVDGSVHVIGSIYSGGYIKATGDIIIEHNVETAQLIAGGNIMIKKGSCSKNDCFIEAGGEVSGSFFEAANINAGGDVKANYIMNSIINTKGRVIVAGNKAILLGGKICAIKGIDTYNLGNRLHIKTYLDIGRNELYAKVQEQYAADREQLLEELDALEKVRNKMRILCATGKDVPEEQQRKVFAAIEVKTQKLAELDGEAAKLANLTEPTMKEPIRVRGRAYEGSMITINGISYVLPAEVRRAVFKLRNKQVVMVSL